MALPSMNHFDKKCSITSYLPFHNVLVRNSLLLWLKYDAKHFAVVHQCSKRKNILPDGNFYIKNDVFKLSYFTFQWYCTRDKQICIDSMLMILTSLKDTFFNYTICMIVKNKKISLKLIFIGLSECDFHVCVCLSVCVLYWPSIDCSLRAMTGGRVIGRCTDRASIVRFAR